MPTICSGATAAANGSTVSASPTQHPRHRLHPVQRHCLQSGKGLSPGCRRRAGQGIYFRLPVRHARSGQRLRPHGPHVRPARRIRGALSHKKRAMISHTPQNRIPSPAANRIIPMGDGAFCVRFFQTKCTAHKTANTRIDLTSGANPSASVLMPPSVESIIFSAVARIMATTQGRTPERKASTLHTSSGFQHRRDQQDDEERGQHHTQRSDQRPRKAALR